MRTLTSTSLAGLWAAVPTPWTQAGLLAEDALAKNCETLAQCGADGIYTTDSDGEFYAIELQEFRRLAEVFGKVAKFLKIDAAMGVTWCNTQGTVDRIKAAVDAGVPNVHVALPFWMPLANSDVTQFFEDLATATPDSRWIHYAHPSAGPKLTGKDYAELALTFSEQFIGTKLGTTDLMELNEILINSPKLAHFVVDTTIFPGVALGARGAYCYWFNTLPRWHRSFVDTAIEKNHGAAAEMQKRLLTWEFEHTLKLRQHGYRHGTLGKARGALTGLLADTGTTRAPYQPVPEKLQAEYKAAFLDFWRDELTEEDLPNSPAEA